MNVRCALDWMNVLAYHLKHYVNVLIFILVFSTQPLITCSNLTVETQEQGVKYVQS